MTFFNRHCSTAKINFLCRPIRSLEHQNLCIDKKVSASVGRSGGLRDFVPQTPYTLTEIGPYATVLRLSVVCLRRIYYG